MATWNELFALLIKLKWEVFGPKSGPKPSWRAWEDKKKLSDFLYRRYWKAGEWSRATRSDYLQFSLGSTLPIRTKTSEGPKRDNLLSTVSWFRRIEGIKDSTRGIRNENYFRKKDIFHSIHGKNWTKLKNWNVLAMPQQSAKLPDWLKRYLDFLKILSWQLTSKWSLYNSKILNWTKLAWGSSGISELTNSFNYTNIKIT